MTALVPLYDKKIKCPLCEASFTTKKVRSRFVKVKKYDSDFCPTYSSEESNPILYYINVCPSCGFSFSDDLTPYFPPGTKEILYQHVSSKWVQHDFGDSRTISDAIKTYKLGIYCSTLKKEKHVAIAGMYLRLSWLYRTTGDVLQEQRFTRLSNKEYLESYLSGDFQGTQVSEVKLLYLLGDLSIRTGQIEQATKYLSKVIEKQRTSVETKIIDLAKERWYEIRDEQKAQ